MNSINTFKVVVKCFTYNHSQYIEEAMDGFCIQQTTFPFVCCIVDDASTDNEPEVIAKYLDSHFNMDDAAVVRHEENDDYRMVLAQHKTNRNCFFAVYYLKYNHYRRKPKKYYLAEWTKDRYIAVNEGDDYWIDPLKLQKQADVLDAHPEVDMCACAASMQKNGREKLRIAPADCETIIPFEKVIVGGGRFVATNSLMYRSSIHDDPNNASKLMGLDFFLQMGGAQRGGMYYLPDLMSVYRVGVEGSWTRRTNANSSLRFNHLTKVFVSLCKLDQQTNYHYTESLMIVRNNDVYSMFRAGLKGNLFKEQIHNMSFLGRMHFVFLFFKKVLFKF